MKKLFALLLALTLVFSLAATAAAAEGDDANTVTVTVNSEVSSHTFVAYQLLTGTQSESEGALGNVAWGNGINVEAFLTALKADATVGTAFAGVTDEKTFVAAMATLADNSDGAKAVAKIADKNKNGNGTALTSGNNTLATGYYLIVDTTDVSGKDESKNNSLLQVTSDIAITAKTAKPTVDKQVLDDNVTGDKEANSTDGWGETADHAMNETFKFKLIASLPNDTDFAAYDSYKVVFNDTMSAGVTFESIASVTVDGQPVNAKTDENTNGYTSTASADQKGGSWTLTIDDIKGISGVDLSNGAVIEVIYNAHLNESAAVGNVDTNKNTVYLEYSNNPNAGGEGSLGKTNEDTVWVFTYKMDNKKVDGQGQALAGAGFKLYSDAECISEVPVIYDNTLSAYRKIKTGETGVEMTSAETSGVFNIIGLDVGTYYLKETTTPDGYNTCDVVTVIITATHQESADAKSATTNITMTQNGTQTEVNTIINNKGTELPETGGMGTTLFYIVGGIMVAAAVVLLVTKKCMGAEA